MSPPAPPTPASFLQQNQARLTRDDVLLASYPRSGNDWLRLMVADVLLQRAGADFSGGEAPVHISRIVPGIYRNDIGETYRHAPTEPAIDLPFVVVKTHEPFADLTERAICLVRRPADALASHFRFQAGHGDAATAGGPDAFCLRQLGAWSDLVASYLALPSARLLVVIYEAMHADTAGALSRVLSFLGIEAAPEEVSAAVERQAIAARQAWEDRLRTVDPNLRALPRLVNAGQIGAGAASLMPGTRAHIAEQTDTLYNQARARAA